MNFFTNPNIHTTLAERVPCAFAPSPDGVEYGTHYVVLMLDADKNIVYVSCECEEPQGTEIIETIHDMGSENNDTCFHAVGKIRKVLEGVDDSASNGVPSQKDSLLQKALSATARKVRNIRTGRTDSKLALEAAERVLSWPRLTDCKILEDIANAVSKTNVFRVNWNSAGGFHTISFYNRALAVREPTDQSWTVEQSYRFTNGKVSVAQHEGHRYLGLGPAYPNTYCIFCNDYFSRMSKHTASMAHHDAINSAVRKALKFTAGKGLKAVQQRGVDFFRHTGRNTKKKREREQDRILGPLVRPDQDYAKISYKEYKAYTSELGLKDVVVRNYSDRSRVPYYDAKKLFEEVEKNPGLISNLWEARPRRPDVSV